MIPIPSIHIPSSNIFMPMTMSRGIPSGGSGPSSSGSTVMRMSVSVPSAEETSAGFLIGGGGASEGGVLVMVAVSVGREGLCGCGGGHGCNVGEWAGYLISLGYLWKCQAVMGSDKNDDDDEHQKTDARKALINEQ